MKNIICKNGKNQKYIDLLIRKKSLDKDYERNNLYNKRKYNNDNSYNSIAYIIKNIKLVFVLQNKLFIRFFLLINFIFSINSERNKGFNNRILFLLTEIKILIKGTGSQNILKEDFFLNNPPSTILVNGNIGTSSGNQITDLEEEENLITMRWDYNLESTGFMFYGMENLIGVDLGNFNASEIQSMNSMFEDCINLISINFGIFKSPKLENMASIFMGCISLEYIDLSSIVTSSLTNMGSMFYECNSLTSINFGNFKTSEVTSMYGLFSNCYSLTYLNLSIFDVSSVENMGFMFESCTSLVSLDLSNFRTTSINNLGCLFMGCTNLEYVDISNFDIRQVTLMHFAFYNCNNLKYVNLNNLIEGESLNVVNMFYGVPEDFSYCISNKNNIPLIMGEINTKNCTINDCSDNWNSKTKKIISEKSICVYNCAEDEQYIYEYKNKCYDNCPNIYSLPNENNECIIICPEIKPFEKNEECISECSAKEFFSEECIINNKNINSKEKMVNIISNNIMNGLMDSSLHDLLNENINDLIIEDDKEVYKISSTDNLRYNGDNNEKIIIDFENCENILKDNNIINNDEKLIIFEMDYIIEEFYIPIIEYKIFHPDTKEKIDLNICNETLINLFIPVDIEENDLYIYNPFSEYYKNKDYPNIIDNNDANILKERRENFNDNYLSLCEKNCIYKEYDVSTKKVLCECKVKNNFSQLSEIINNKNNLLFHITEDDLETDSETNLSTESDKVQTSFPDSETDSDNTDTDSFQRDSLDTDFGTEGEPNINTETNMNTEGQIKKCLFKERITKICEEIVTFEDLIDKNYIPLDNKDSIDKVFEIISSEFKEKNKTIEDIIEGENVIFQMTTTENQNNYYKNNDYHNISLIDFGRCEEILREQNKIDIPLIIIKVDIKRDDSISTQVEYEVFNPYTLEKLNLSLCENEKINVYPPIILDQRIIDLYKNLKAQGYELFKSNDKFYNDICSPYNSLNNTDVILNDRKNDYYISNISLCEENCEYEDFNTDTLKANCKCTIKKEVISESHKVKFSPNKIIENFYKVEKYANIRVAICYRQVFNIERLKKNLGSHITIIISFFFVIFISINFVTLGNKTRTIIYKLIFESNSILNKLSKNIKKNKRHETNKQKTDKPENKKPITKKKLFSNDKNLLKLKNNYNKKNNKNKNKNKISNPRKKNSNNNIFKAKDEFFSSKSNLNLKPISKNKNKENKIFTYNTNSSSLSSYQTFLSPKKRIKKEKKEINFIPSQKQSSKLSFEVHSNKINMINMSFIEKVINFIPKKERIKYFSEDELNSLEYKYALKIDFRNYFQFYFSLLKQSHLIIFTFFVNDYNLFLLKLSLFLISFELFFFMNALFFSDESLHKIYEDGGKYDFIYQIPKMLYSTIVSQVISSLLEKLSLSQDLILELKEKGDIKLIKREINKVIKCIKIKCLFFFIIGIILLFSFWYYLSAFCAVYYNTQMALVKDNFISFITSMLYPFLFDLIPGIFRVLSLKIKNKCLYMASKFFTIVIGIL